MKDKITHLFPHQQPQMTLAEANKKTKEDLPALADYFRLHAYLTKVKYEALRKEGFTPEEALCLCQKLF